MRRATTWIVGLIVLSGASSTLTQEQPAEAVKLEFRLAATEAAPGLLEAENVSTNRTIYLQAEAFLSNEHVQSAVTTTDGRGQPAIQVVFTPEGSRIMATVTGDHIGELVAILIDGVVTSSDRSGADRFRFRPNNRELHGGGGPADRRWNHVTVDYAAPDRQRPGMFC